jgi:methionine aminopeptidase
MTQVEAGEIIKKINKYTASNATPNVDVLDLDV